MGVATSTGPPQDSAPHRTSRSALSNGDRTSLVDILGDAVRFDEPMSRRTTLRIGGPADAFASPSSIEDLRRVIALCAARGLPMIAVGSGSNLLVRDGGVRGVVIAARNLRSLERRGGDDDGGDAGDATVEIYVECGVSTGKLLSSATQWSLGGVEFLGGVPGSVGGGMRMNAGTYLGEFKDVTTSVTTVRLSDGTLVVRPAAACGFVYRDSALPYDEMVVSATLALRPRPRADIEEDVRGLRQRRREREPAKVSNAGSIFKNPPGDFAGRLIEASGLKGTQIGGALCSPVHANWLVNVGDATAADLLALIDVVRTKVAADHDVTLALEVKVIGED